MAKDVVYISENAFRMVFDKNLIYEPNYRILHFPKI